MLHIDRINDNAVATTNDDNDNDDDAEPCVTLDVSARPAANAADELIDELRRTVLSFPGMKFPVPFDVDGFVYEPIFVIERKIVADLANSIRGRGSNGSALNRFKDQKLRLLAFARQNGCRPFLLVEGMHAYAGHHIIEGMPEKAIDTALTNTEARDGICVHHRRNVQETMRWLGILCATIVKNQMRPGAVVAAGGQPLATRDALTNHGQAISLRKSDNLTPALAYRTWLMTARGMTNDKASCIIAAHPNLAGLVATYNGLEARTLARKTPKQTARVLETMLADLIIPGQVTANGHGRRIGPALSKAVYTRLFAGGGAPPDPLPDAGHEMDEREATARHKSGKKRKVVTLDDDDGDDRE